ncbi:hypothetical protein V2J09_000563 [Rumex salicifolius]
MNSKETSFSIVPESALSFLMYCTQLAINIGDSIRCQISPRFRCSGCSWE